MTTGSWRVVLSGLTLVAASACGGGSTGERSGPDVPATTVPDTAARPTTVASPPTSAVAPATSAPSPGPTAPSPAPPAVDGFGPCDGTHGAGVAVGSLALRDGADGWRICSAGEAYRSILGATEDAVYVESSMTGGASSVTALDARTGAVRWSRSVVRTPWGWPAGPFAAGGVVVLTIAADEAAGGAPTLDPFGASTVVGVDASTGEERWRLGPDDRIVTATSAPLPTFGPQAGGPAVAPGALIANTPTMAVLASLGGVLGIDRSTGATRWTLDLMVQDLAGTGVARSPAAVSGETVVMPASTPDGEGPVAVDGRSGRLRWRLSTPLDHPTAADGVAVGYDSRDQSGGDPAVVAVAIDDGTVRWTQPGMPSYGDLWAVGDGVAVVRTMDGVLAYDLTTGALRWRRAGGPDLPGEPQVMAGGLAVLLWERDLGVLSASTGDTVWARREPFGSGGMSTVAANATTLFVSVNSRPWGD